MKTKRERIYYYPYEYKALQPHLQEMARKGWMLLDIIDHNYYMTFKYEECEPQEVYYHTDFSEDTSYFMYGVASDKTSNYNDFLESYGYHFVTGKKGLMVYMSDTDVDFELREDTPETLKQLRKATYKSIVFPLLMGCFGAFGLWFPLQHLVFDFQSYLWADSNAFMTDLQYTFMFLLFSYICAPVFIWRIKQTFKTSFAKMKLRYRLILVGIFMWLSTLIFRFNQTTFIATITVLIPLSVIAIVWNYILTKKKPIRICYIIVTGIMCVGIIQTIPYIVVSNMDEEKSTVSTFDASRFTLSTDTPQYVNRSSSIFLSSEDTVFEYGDQGAYSYQIFYIKDTIFHDYIVSHIPYEYEEVVSKEVVDKDTIYKTETHSLIHRGDVMLRLDNDLYELIQQDGVVESMMNEIEQT